MLQAQGAAPAAPCVLIVSPPHCFDRSASPRFIALPGHRLTVPPPHRSTASPFHRPTFHRITVPPRIPNRETRRAPHLRISLLVRTRWYAAFVLACPVAAMSIASTGIGSGLDVATLVQQLVASERAPTATRIDRFERETKAEISAFASLRSAFDGLRTALGRLRSDDTVLARKTSVPDEAGFTASAAAGAATGRYGVEVLALASAHKLASGAFSGSDVPVGTGRLTITSGQTTLQVDIDAQHATLDGIRDEINRVADGTGVTATLVEADDGTRLVLSATEPGVANALRITTSGGDGGLSALRHEPPGAALQELEAATDARIAVDGFVRTSTSNRISGVVEGVTFTLTKAAPGTVHSMGVDADPGALRTAAKGLVTAYNAATNAIASSTKYDPTTKVAAALNGDALMRGISRDFRSQVGNAVQDLKALGITIGTDGLLKMDDAAFDAALAKDPAPARRLFSADDGLAAGLEASLGRLLDDDGLLDGREEGLSARTKSIASQRTALEKRMGDVEARYRAQFVALDAMMAQMQSTSSYLAQQLDKL
jgi:flagellar hook-associated protein 2